MKILSRHKINNTYETIIFDVVNPAFYRVYQLHECNFSFPKGANQE